MYHFQDLNLIIAISRIVKTTMLCTHVLIRFLSCIQNLCCRQPTPPYVTIRIAGVNMR